MYGPARNQPPPHLGVFPVKKKPGSGVLGMKPEPLTNKASQKIDRRRGKHNHAKINSVEPSQFDLFRAV